MNKKVFLLVPLALSLLFSSCGEKPQCQHADSNHDHYCDLCGEKISEHHAGEHSHNCDWCGQKISDHIDTTGDGKCDICGEDITPPTPKQLHTISLQDSYEHGDVTVDKYFAYKGDEITLTITIDEGYELLQGNLKFNTTPIVGNKFIMPDENVTIYATFTKIPVIYPDTDMICKSKVEEREATAYFEAKYEGSGVLFKITTFDEEIISNSTDLDKNDGVCLLVNRTSETKGLETDQTIYFRSTAKGYYEVYRARTKNSFSENCDPSMLIFPGINFYTNAYTTSFNNLSAYVVNVYISYDLMGTTYAAGYKNITMCPGLVNANSDGVHIELGQRIYSYKCYWKNCKSFALINDTNRFTQRATGTDDDVIDPSLKPENYIYGANFVGRTHWTFARMNLAETVSLEDVDAIIVAVRFNELNQGDWFRLAAITDDGTFCDAFGKDSAKPFKYSCSEYLKEVADYDWETGGWGGWDPTWTSKVPPTFYVEVPLEVIFARFNINGTMKHPVSTPMKDLRTLNLAQIGIYMTADNNYNFSIGNTYVRRNGVIEQISDPVNYSKEPVEGKDYPICSRIDSDGEKESSVEIFVYPTPKQD